MPHSQNDVGLLGGEVSFGHFSKNSRTRRTQLNQRRQVKGFSQDGTGHQSPPLSLCQPKGEIDHLSTTTPLIGYCTVVVAAATPCCHANTLSEPLPGSRTSRPTRTSDQDARTRAPSA